MNALTLFWPRGRYQEGEAAYARVLDAASEQPTILRGRALAGRGYLGVWGSHENVPAWSRTALEIGQACGDAWTQGRALGTLGLAISLGDPASGRPLLQRSIELATQAGDDWYRVHAAQFLAAAWFFQDEFDTARPILDDAYTTATRVRYHEGIAIHWFYLGWEGMIRGQLNEARELFRRSIAASDEVGDPAASGFTNCLLTHVHLVCGETERAYALADATLQRMREIGVGFTLGMAQQALGRTELALGKFAAAREHLHNAVNVDCQGMLYLFCWALTGLGTLERVVGDLQAAHDHGEQALESARRLGSGWMQAGAERLLARLALAAGNSSDAECYAQNALARLQAKGLALDIPECLDILAAIAATQEHFDHAARLLGAAAANRQRLGITRFPPEPTFWASVERTTKDVLGDNGYHSAYTQGTALGTEEALT
jgi:tetratricopeptide (TPR) repeat protein